MIKEKVRIYVLARELGMESKDLVALCRQNGIEVKSQLSSIEPEERDQIVQLMQQKGSSSSSAPPRSVPTLPPSKIRVLETKPRPVPPPELGRTKAVPQAETAAKPTLTPVPPVSTGTPVPPISTITPPPSKSAEPALPVPTLSSARPPVPSLEKTAPPAPPSKPPEQPLRPKVEQTPPPPQATPSRPVETPTPARAETPPSPETPRPPSKPPVAGTRVRDLGGNRSSPGQRRPQDRRGGPRPILPVAPLPLKQKSTPPQEKKKAAPAGPKKLAEIPAELQNRSGGSPVDIHDITRALQQQQTPGKPSVVVTEEFEDEEDGGKAGAKKPHRRGVPGVAGRDERHKLRNDRQAARKKGMEAPDPKHGGVALLDEETETHRKRRPGFRPKTIKPTMPRKGKVPVQLPITVRSLSEAIGIRHNDIISKLMSQGLMARINDIIEPDIAEAIALDFGCELDVKKQADAEEQMLAETRKPDHPEDLVPRAPIVTIMGHVDHGKTSLLDRIRKSNVTATEAGGITQVIRAWRVLHDGKPITFLDTPGHEAFTKMRARGAHVTDIAVIVVAADDGVMPQTEEAINHAKAAGVSIVVAINKIDLPNANLRKTEQQLYGLGLIPDNMGGEVPFVQTSAATGKGIDDLLETLS
ncbi:MAG: translation initiation factor IF-2 N-terminal domain-containing protein, partial [Gemmataceae bacterium]